VRWSEILARRGPGTGASSGIVLLSCPRVQRYGADQIGLRYEYDQRTASRKIEAEMTAANSAIVDEYVTTRTAIGAVSSSSSLVDRHGTDRALRSA